MSTVTLYKCIVAKRGNCDISIEMHIAILARPASNVKYTLYYTLYVHFLAPAHPLLQAHA